MWSDNETNIDCIDFQYYINAVCRIINDDSLLPCSIGTFGDWGGGKSSLMKMISEKYDSETEVLVIKFNGWLFEGYEDAKTVLMGSIVDEIVKKRTLTEKAIKIAAKLLKRIDFMKLGSSALKYGVGFATLGPAGLAIAATSDAINKVNSFEYEKYVKDKDDSDENLRNSIQEFHKNFEDLISETKLKKVLVFIDDLDRCSPETIIDTLEAIKLFLFAQKTVFIIGADERLIRYAVRRRFPEIPGDNAEVGRDYLEKLIQHPVRIPFLSNIEIETYVNLLFSKLYLAGEQFEKLRKKVFEEKNKKGFAFVFNRDNAKELLGSEPSSEHAEALLLSSQITPVLTTGLNGNPRQCKRFLNTLLLRYGMAASREIKLKKRVLAKLMLLEYFKPETFKLFYEFQAANNGIIKELALLETLAASKKDRTESKSNGSKLSPELEASFNDPWIKDWFTSEPFLKDENLQAYFYFSRDRLSASGTNIRQRMTPVAQEIFIKLISDSEAARGNGLKACNNLSSGEATAIFEAMTERIETEEDDAKNRNNFKTIIEFCKIRKDQLSQLFIFLENLPEQIVSVAIIPWLKDLVVDTEYKSSLNKLFKKWENSKVNSKLPAVLKKQKA